MAAEREFITTNKLYYLLEAEVPPLLEKLSDSGFEIIAVILYGSVVTGPIKTSLKNPSDIDLAIITNGHVSENLSLPPGWQKIGEQEKREKIDRTIGFINKKPNNPPIEVWVWPVAELETALTNNDKPNVKKIAKQISTGQIIYIPDQTPDQIETPLRKQLGLPQESKSCLLIDKELDKRIKGHIK